AVAVLGRVALPSEQVRGDVDAVPQLVQPGEVELPLRVDEHVALRAAALARTDRDERAVLGRPRQRLRLDWALRGGWILNRDVRVGELARRVVPGEAAFHHPLVGEPFVRRELEARVARFISWPVRLELRVARLRAHAAPEAVPRRRVRDPVDGTG